MGHLYMVGEEMGILVIGRGKEYGDFRIAVYNYIILDFDLFQWYPRRCLEVKTLLPWFPFEAEVFCPSHYKRRLEMIKMLRTLEEPCTSIDIG